MLTMFVGTTSAQAGYDPAYEAAAQGNSNDGNLNDCDVDQWNTCRRNCTSYVAYRLNSVGVPFNNNYRGVQWGHARNWDDAARATGVATGPTPKVGAIAFWNEPYGAGYGHVAWVESVNGDGSVRTSNYNGLTEQFYTESAARPHGYIYFSNVGSDSALSNRMALINSAGQVYAKDDINAVGGWFNQESLARSISVSGDRMALINSAGEVFAKDHLGAGGWLDQNAKAATVAVGSGGRMALINSAGEVFAKDNLGAGGWLDQAATAKAIAVGQYRMAIVTPCGAVYAKDHLGAGGWIKQSECNTAKAVSVSRLGTVGIITTDDQVYAKDNINGVGGWQDQKTSAIQLELGGDRLAILTPDKKVYAKNHLGAGGWIDQGATATTIALGTNGRLVIINPAGQVYAKDRLEGGGWLDQNATARSIAG